MSDPKKEQIAQDLLDALGNIRVQGGYYTDAGLYVSRRRVPLGTWNTTHKAEVFVFCGKEAAAQACIGNSYQSRAEFMVIGYICDREPDRMAVLLEADIKKAVLTDPSRTSLAVSTELGETDTDYWELVQDDQAIVILPFHVTYSWTAASP